MKWTLDLDCSECGAKVHFEDEKPDWKYERGQRYLTCPACEGRCEPSPRQRLDVNLGNAFSAFMGGKSRSL